MQPKQCNWRQCVIAVQICLVLVLICGCATRHTDSVARQLSEPYVLAADFPPAVTVIYELKYYVIGDKVGVTPLRVSEEGGQRLYSISEPFRLLGYPDPNLMLEVRGFVFEIVSPREHAGKLLTAHFDGPGSGDPFNAFSFGQRYRMEILPVAIGNLKFGLCW